MANSNFYEIELRDKAGYLKKKLTPWAQNPTWEWNRIGGCGRCRITLGMEYRKIEISAGDDIQIWVRSNSAGKLVYRGWVSCVTPILKTPQEIILDVRGYFDRLEFLAVHDAGDKKTYTNQIVSAIVENIIDTYVTPNTVITKGTIDNAIFSPDSLQFKAKVSEALKTLAELEGKVEYGVDANLVFFWRTQSDALREKFFVGNNVERFERRVDWNRLLNRICFEGGDVAGSPYIKIAEAVDSQLTYFLSEGFISNSSIVTSAVADQYLSSLLRDGSSPKIIMRAKIPNIELRLEDTLPIGAIAVYDADHDESEYIVGEVGDGGSDLIVGLTPDGGSNATIGGVYSGQVDRITYTLSNTEERFNIEISTGGSVDETYAKIKQIELLLSSLRQNQ